MQILWGECISGALYNEDFKRLAREAGFADPRILLSSRIDVTDPQLAQITGNAVFTSITYRLFKLPNHLESLCEDYGQVATYKVNTSKTADCQGRLQRLYIFCYYWCILSNGHARCFGTVSLMHLTCRSALHMVSEMVYMLQGSIKGHEHSYQLDDHHTFVTGKPMLVCGNTAAMVGEEGISWLSKHFQVKSLWHLT